MVIEQRLFSFFMASIIRALDIEEKQRARDLHEWEQKFEKARTEDKTALDLSNMTPEFQEHVIMKLFYAEHVQCDNLFTNMTPKQKEIYDMFFSSEKKIDGRSRYNTKLNIY